jgi:alkyl sulfatase BDS1-like metallo-beta-lactamase superfamily hydrolase
VIVQARPNELAEVRKLIERIDRDEPAATSRMKVMRLKNAVAEELSSNSSQASQAVISPPQQTAGQGGVGGFGNTQGAQELRDGPAKPSVGSFSPDVLAATTTSMLLDIAAVRLNPDKALARPVKINLVLSDRGETHLIQVRNGVMIHEAGIQDPAADVTVTMKRPVMLMTLYAGAPAAAMVASGAIAVTGDISA